MYDFIGDLLFLSASAYYLWSNLQSYLELDQNNLKLPVESAQIKARSRAHLMQVSLFYLGGILIPLFVLAFLPLLTHALWSGKTFSVFRALIVGCGSGLLLGASGWVTIWSMISLYFLRKLQTENFVAALSRNSRAKDDYHAFCNLIDGVVYRSASAVLLAILLVVATCKATATTTEMIAFVILLLTAIPAGITLGLTITRLAHFRFIKN